MIRYRPLQEKDYFTILTFLEEFEQEHLFKILSRGGDYFNIFCKLLGTSFVAFDETKEEVVGVLIGFITSVPLGTDKIWQEMFWYLKPALRNHSKEMLQRLETYCKDWGVKYIVMAHFGSQNRSLLDKFFKMNKYNYLETHYLKQIGG